MRKVFASLAAVVLGGALFLATPAAHAASERCKTTPVADTGTDGATSASVCGPGAFAVTVAVIGTGGYIVADGDSTNQDPADGYIGVDTKSVIVCSDQGDYKHSSSSTCSP